jgi:hypothetical protein
VNLFQKLRQILTSRIPKDLDWLFVLVGRKPFVDPKLDDNATIEQLIRRAHTISGASLVEFYQRCIDHYDLEEQRSSTIDSKAFAILASSGIVLTLLISTIEQSFGSGTMWGWPQSVVAVLYGIALAFFLQAVVCSLNAVKVRSTHLASAKDLFSLASISLEDAQRTRAASIYYAYIHNCRIGNIKTTYLIGALLGFQRAIFIVVIAVAFSVLTRPLVRVLDNDPSGMGSTTPSSTAVPHRSHTVTPPP